jgi:hypothetical protein
MPFLVIRVHGPALVAQLAVVFHPSSSRRADRSCPCWTCTHTCAPGRVVALFLDSSQLLCELADFLLDLFDPVHAIVSSLVSVS